MTPSCAVCVYNRTPCVIQPRDAPPAMVCARRPSVDGLLEPCEDWCDDISEDVRITGGHRIECISPGRASTALAAGETVAVAYTWYRIIDGRPYSLSPRGDNPVPAVGDPVLKDIYAQICYRIDLEDQLEGGI